MVKAHTNTFMALEELGSTIPGYRPTHDFPGKFINKFHRFLSTCPCKDGVLVQLRTSGWPGHIIEGWLRREDALKLYEIAYFARGDVLELGSYHGLSTCILSQAVHDSPYKKTIYSVDLDPWNVEMTRRNLLRRGVAEYAQLIVDDALFVVTRFAAEGRRLSFVFVDHSHTYEAVFDVCRELGRIVAPGGFCLFHDFNDARNWDVENKEYGVYQAVQDGLSPTEFEFYGIYGCAALYRKK